MTRTTPVQRHDLHTGPSDPRQAKRRRLVWRLATAIVVTAVLGIALLWSPAPDQQETHAAAPDFTLSRTDGSTITLSDLRPGPVILYFNEGAGCASCTVQMAAIEKHPGFEEAGITVLPIVMNTAEQITPDMAQFGVTTPYLLDNGIVSEAYDVLDKGMHPGLPGHGFVLIDGEGIQRWYGNYPSMWLEPEELLDVSTEILGLS
ncbi:redoxin domain-containing protein [Flaviflexus salsibiostraticola]|uniref:Redoxin domain-containing protein n=1 Tax=Flaviflexus salsibiostraticola TaxID=1282737 RepID=A0A3S8ZAB4_9ACTO|nr:peroxiredoxin family protein [Flaviflexus salsibiostraticola]AZN30411.1 redoxin domain-containing protein [Flaviflexus salsibiostraticola]